MTERFQILSLDGGGIKGLFSAALLAHFEEDHGINIADHFDLIAGTSTGGIIALGLGMGLKPREIVNFYKNEGPGIFRGGLLARFKHYIWGPKYPQAPLSDALKKTFKDARLQDSKKRLVVPSFNLEKGEVYVFKTRHIPRYKRDYMKPIWQVALATASAPTYFPACCEVDKIRLIDGGVWANNPTMAGVVEAIGPLGRRASSIRVLSIGTSYAVKQRPDLLDRGGIIRWVWSSSMVDIPFEGQSHAAIGQAQLLVGHDNVHRINPVVPDGVLAMDRLDLPRLEAEAAHQSRIESPKIEKLFLDHKAAPFTPEPLEPQSAKPST